LAYNGKKQQAQSVLLALLVIALSSIKQLPPRMVDLYFIWNETQQRI
jgi:hypothetical protein